MAKGWFEYKGINSLDMHLKIVNDISFPSPEADVEFVEVLGRDGDVAVDNNRLKGVDFPVPAHLKLPKNMDVNIAATKISEWLKTDIGWYPLRFSGSSEYEYIAMCYEQFDVQETLKQFGKTVIHFRLKPYKRKVGNRSIIMSNGMTLINHEKRISKPLIHIRGNGSVALHNNGKLWLFIENVEDEIVIDSESMDVYKGESNQFKKMIGDISPMFPILTPGENKITWMGNAEIEIEPRWEAVL